MMVRKAKPSESKQPVSKARPIVLSIAGFDPSSGAGITADIKTMAAHKCYGVSCITALTVQSTRGVVRVEPVEGRVITETLDELATDLNIAAVKIGMLGSAEAARAVAGFLKRHRMRHVVLDPILKSSSGMDLISKEGLLVLQNRLLAMATVITPNIAEASLLTRLTVSNADEMAAAALRLHQLGARHVIITGGHLDPPVDLVSPEPGTHPTFISGAKIAGSSTHGTGCAFATSLACNLALGKPLVDAARAAKRYVESALRHPPAVGKGVGPII
ncbi:MAG: bifunctional hydroxymethylpyrimidine kinase/phosphomethylpyrimidine kinase [Acidobacteriia bacterium]|nr:bifunctional hydroxymethylpyrimidine kinase/phosphomethylpyrimidine kinase [Terriglobia bacterium]